jgi:hypothetical protein
MLPTLLQVIRRRLDTARRRAAREAEADMPAHVSGIHEAPADAEETQPAARMVLPGVAGAPLARTDGSGE